MHGCAEVCCHHLVELMLADTLAARAANLPESASILAHVLITAMSLLQVEYCLNQVERDGSY
jgi:hypothetical protein